MNKARKTVGSKNKELVQDLQVNKAKETLKSACMISENNITMKAKTSEEPENNSGVEHKSSDSTSDGKNSDETMLVDLHSSLAEVTEGMSHLSTSVGVSCSPNSTGIEEFSIDRSPEIKYKEKTRMLVNGGWSERTGVCCRCFGPSSSSSLCFVRSKARKTVARKNKESTHNFQTNKMNETLASTDAVPWRPIKRRISESFETNSGDKPKSSHANNDEKIMFAVVDLNTRYMKEGNSPISSPSVNEGCNFNSSGIQEPFPVRNPRILSDENCSKRAKVSCVCFGPSTSRAVCLIHNTARKTIRRQS